MKTLTAMIALLLTVSGFARADIAGLSECSAAAAPANIVGIKPVAIIVHGLNGHPSHFEQLAKTFTDSGQQAFCFNYDDRDSLEKSALQLQQTITVVAETTPAPITVVGHSLGGLVARAALSDKRQGSVASLDSELQLVTIATPFAGVRKARHCVSTFMKVVTLGLSGPTCRAVSGDKWHEITHASDFIRSPGMLASNVTRHLKIATDEEHACKSLLGLSPCLPGGYVFTLQEQFHPLVDEEPNVTLAVIKAGHREVIGSEKLASLLARTGLTRSENRLATNTMGTSAGYDQKTSL